MQLKFFILVWKFASARKSISHCKLFEVTGLYIVLCLHNKVAEGPPLAHIFVLFWKTYDLLQSLQLQSGSSAFKQSNAKTKCESLKEGPHGISEKRGPRRQPCSPSLISTPALNYIQKKELASFCNTPMWRHKNIFRSFRHVAHYIVRWANNETASIEIISTTIQKKWRYIVYRLKTQL